MYRAMKNRFMGDFLRGDGEHPSKKNRNGFKTGKKRHGLILQFNSGQSGENWQVWKIMTESASSSSACKDWRVTAQHGQETWVGKTGRQG